MKTIATNEQNDIFVNNSGNLAISEGLQARANIATNKTRTVYGEVPLAAQAGIPFFDVIFNKFQPQLFEQFLRQTLLETPGAIEVRQYNYTISGGVLTYSAVLVTEEGEANING